MIEPPEPTKVTNNGELVYDCPICGDNKGRFRLNPEKGIWYCYRHSEGGRIESLRRTTGIAWPLDEEAKNFRTSDRDAVDALLVKAFGTYAPKKKKSKPAIDYTSISEAFTITRKAAKLAGLGSVDHLVKLHKLGKEWYDYSTNVFAMPGFPWNVVIQAARYLRGRGISFQEAVDWNLCVPTDRGLCNDKLNHFGRVVIPFWNPGDTCLRSLQARTISQNTTPKYLGPLARSMPGALLFSPKALIRASCRMLREPVIVEGPLDAIAVERAGFPVVALCGKNLQKEALETLVLCGIEMPTILLDSKVKKDGSLAKDNPDKSASKLCSIFLRAGFKVKRAELILGDPGEATTEEIKSAMSLAAEVTITKQLGTIVGGVVGRLLSSPPSIG